MEESTKFDKDLGKLSPLSEFRGPKVPSWRQTIRMFLSFFKPPVSKFDAARLTVAKVLERHAGNPTPKVQTNFLENKLKTEYDKMM